MTTHPGRKREEDERANRFLTVRVSPTMLRRLARQRGDATRSALVRHLLHEGLARLERARTLPRLPEVRS